MAPRLRRRQEASPRSIPTTRRCNRSSVSLRGARAAKIRAQLSWNLKPPRSKDMPIGTGEKNQVNVAKGHPSCERRLDHVAWPQRSSLRSALRESQKLSKEILPTTTSPSPSPAPARNQLLSQEPGSLAKGAQTGAGDDSASTHSSELPDIIASKVMPQRNSLRRAIRESLKSANTSHDSSSPSAYRPELDLTQSNGLTLGLVEKPGAGTLDRAVSTTSTKRDTNSLSHNPRGGVASLATPQRSSLRRAVRESLRAAVPRNTYHDTALDVASPDHGNTQDNITKNGTKKSPSDDQSNGINLLSELPEATLIHLGAVDLAKTLPQHSCTSSISSESASPTPLTPVSSRLLTVLRPRKGSIRESHPVAKSPVSQSSFSSFGSSPRLVPTTKPRDESKSATFVSEPQISSVTLIDKNMLGDRNLSPNAGSAQSVPARKGWHQVREITNEVPGGLYLVEWEGQDPRTGVKWPASWVKAENVSESAICDWNERKHRMLLGSREEL
ncbi:hypothetical protein F5Y07DRAFT_362769 [Xylaria sp. FL0933]|nr:hypothetical protein F5Y07DRAFT_362769 [Xylaria sp. FL0933]